MYPYLKYLHRGLTCKLDSWNNLYVLLFFNVLSTEINIFKEVKSVESTEQRLSQTKAGMTSV